MLIQIIAKGEKKQVRITTLKKQEEKLRNEKSTSSDTFSYFSIPVAKA